MQIGGINLDELGAQLAPPAPSYIVLLLDSDQHIYKAASTVKRLDTAIRRFYQLVLEEKFFTNAKAVRAYITPSDNFKCGRYLLPTVKPYQGQRATREEIPLKAPLKAHLIANPHEYAQQGIEIIFDYINEADDNLIADSLLFGDRGLVSSFDKDMQLARGPLWNSTLGIKDIITDRYGWINYDEAAGKVKAHGLVFFWWQMLAGDDADYVKGIKTYQGKPCGKMSAYKAIKECRSEKEAADKVVRAYAAIGQNYLAEAECLFLRRHASDSAYAYMLEVLEDPDLLEWTHSLHQYNEGYIKWRLHQTETNS